MHAHVGLKLHKSHGIKANKAAFSFAIETESFLNFDYCREQKKVSSSNSFHSKKSFKGGNRELHFAVHVLGVEEQNANVNLLGAKGSGRAGGESREKDSASSGASNLRSYQNFAGAKWSNERGINWREGKVRVAAVVLREVCHRGEGRGIRVSDDVARKD